MEICDVEYDTDVFVLLSLTQRMLDDGPAATAFVAMTIPFFGALLGFFGGFAFAPTTYFVSHLTSTSQFFCV